MTSIKAVAAIAVVAVVIVAAAAYMVLSDNGSDTGSVDAIGTSVEVGDYYAIDTEYSSGPNGSPTSESTTYTVSDVNGDTVRYEARTGTETVYESGTSQDFLDGVSTNGYVGQYQRTETIRTFSGDRVCDIYRDSATVGNGQTTVTTLEWIGQGSNVIYRTEITITDQSGQQIITKTLRGTNMMQESQSGSTGPDAPDRPSSSTGIRTDVRVGDYIEYSVYEDDGDRDVESFVVRDVRNGMVIYSERGDDDREWMPASMFVSMILFQNQKDWTPDKTETISTSFGDVVCDVYDIRGYEGGWIFDIDNDEYVTLWVGQDNGVIYQGIQGELFDHHDDREVYKLTGTSLFEGASAPSEPSKPQAGQFGITLTVGDSYTIRDGRNDVETHEVIAVNGSFVTVMEVDGRGWDRDVETMHVDEFLNDFMISQSALDRLTPQDRTETVGGVECDVYLVPWDDDPTTLWIGPDNLIVQKAEWGDDLEVLVSCQVQSAGIHFG